jgi:hypothetical protein
MSKYIVSLEEDPKTGELILPIPDELLVEVGWSEGDELVWEETLLLEESGEYPAYTLRRTIENENEHD